MALNPITRGVNTKRLNRANQAERPLVITFNYRAPRNESGEFFQKVVCRVEAGSLRESNGFKYFTARNIKRVEGDDEGHRTYRVDRITGKIEFV